MRKYLFIITILLIAGISYQITNRPISIRKPACNDINYPCYVISMPNQADLETNSYQHYGHSNCIAFTSLPDGDYHGYCGNYSIRRQHD